MFLKSLLLGIKRKVGEPILILVTVALAVAVLVSAVSLRASVESRLVESYRSLAGEAEYEATFEEDFSAYYTTEDSAEYRLLKDTSALYGELRSGYTFFASVGFGKKEFARVYATDINALAAYRSVDIKEGAMPLSAGGAVVSASFARKIGASVGSRIELTLYGNEKKTFAEITGISEESGVFLTEDVLLFPSVVSRLLSLPEDVKICNKFFVDMSEEKLLSQGVTAEEAAAEITRSCPSFRVVSPVNEDDVALTLRQESTLLFAIAALVAVLGAVLIYTAVTLVMKNRLALASLFRSMGATSTQIVGYLFAEILIYGLLGGVLGVALSFGVSALFNAVVSGVGAVASVSVGGAFIGLVFGALLAIFSACIPVLKVGRMSLADMLRSDTAVVAYDYRPAVVAGILFIAFFFASIFSGVSSALVLGIFAAIFLFAAVINVAPLMLKGVSSLVMRRAAHTTYGTLYLAAAGSKENKHIRAGVRLLSVAVALVVTVASLCGAAAGQLRSFRSFFRADVILSADASDIHSLLEEVRGEAGVEGAYAAYLENKCVLEDGAVATLIAVRGQEYDSVIALDELGFTASDIAGVCRVAIGEGFAMKLGVSLGDTFEMRVNGEDMTFTAAVFIDTPLALIFTDMSGLGVKENVCMLRVSSEDVWEGLAEKYARFAAIYRLRDAFAYAIDVAEAYIRVFVIFDIIVVLFALFGYINNALASYRDRKREFELYTGAGASLADRRRIICVENVIVGGCGILLGALSSVALLYIVQNMLKSFGLYFHLLG